MAGRAPSRSCRPPAGPDRGPWAPTADPRPDPAGWECTDGQRKLENRPDPGPAGPDRGARGTGPSGRRMSGPPAGGRGAVRSGGGPGRTGTGGPPDSAGERPATRPASSRHRPAAGPARPRPARRGGLPGIGQTPPSPSLTGCDRKPRSPQTQRTKRRRTNLSYRGRFAQLAARF